MSDTSVAWSYVAAQAVLLAAQVLAPNGNLWPRPAAVNTSGTIMVIAGAALIVVASVQLRSSHTPLPTPVAHGSLCTGGVYRLCRHPIYLGVLVICLGLTLRRASVVSVAVFVLLIAFFSAKGAWEERRLDARYPDYAAYAARTPRLIPRVPLPRRG